MNLCVKKIILNLLKKIIIFKKNIKILKKKLKVKLIESMGC